MNPVTRATVVVASFLGLHVVLAVWQPVCLWGADLLSYYSVPLQVVFVGLSLGLLLPPSRRAFLSSLARIESRIESSGLPGKPFWIPAVAALTALVLFIVFQSATHLLGDGYLYIRELDEGMWQKGARTDRAPLTFFLIRQLHQLGGSLWSSAESTYRIYSALGGILFVFLSVIVCRGLGRTKTERGVLLAMVLTAGFVQVFFGYVENYALHLVLLLLYLHLAVVSLRNKRAPWIPAVVLGFLLPLHFAYFALIPSLFALTFLCSRHEQPHRNGSCWGTALAISATSVALGALILIAIGFDPVAYFVRDQRSHLLPLFSSPNYLQHYRLFSLNHFLDVLNLVLLVAAAPVLALFITGGFSFVRDRVIAFLFITALGGWLFAFLVNPEIGVYRDWDVLSFGALPLVLAAGLLLARRIPDSGRLAEVGLLISGAAALHAVVWIGVNSDEDRSIARFEHVLQNCPLSEHALSYGWETLGGYFFAVGRNDDATAAYNQAADAAGSNPRHWISLGAILLESGDHVGAMEHFQHALSLNPNRSDVHNKIGLVHLGRDEMKEALESFNRAVQLRPGEAEGYFNRGTIHMRLKRYQQAAADFQRAVELNPGFAAAYSNLASAYYASGQFPTAIQHAEQALKLSPDLGDALYIVGAANWQMNQREKAVLYFRRLLEVDPNNPNADAVRKVLSR